jgi:hypothetical protein
MLAMPVRGPDRLIQFAIGALTVMATDCNEQSVIS